MQFNLYMGTDLYLKITVDGTMDQFKSKQQDNSACFRSDSVFLIPLHLIQVACPQCEIIPEQLHDGCRVAVLVLLQGVQIGDGVVEGLLGELASNGRTVQDFVIEYRVVKGKAETNGVGALKCFTLRDGVFVAILCVLDHLLAHLARRELA